MDINDYLEKAKQGDKTSLKYFYEKYSKEMFNVCIRIVRQRELAHDVLHDAFVIMFQKMYSLRDPDKFDSWFRKIVINEALKNIKNKFLWVEISEELDEVHGIDEENIEWWKDIEISDLLGFMDYLPEGCKQVFNLFAIENLSHSEIANKLGISESTSKTQYRRAKSLLRSLAVKNKEY